MAKETVCVETVVLRWWRSQTLFILKLSWYQGNWLPLQKEAPTSVSSVSSERIVLVSALRRFALTYPTWHATWCWGHLDPVSRQRFRYFPTSRPIRWGWGRGVAISYFPYTLIPVPTQFVLDPASFHIFDCEILYNVGYFPLFLPLPAPSTPASVHLQPPFLPVSQTSVPLHKI